MDYTKLSLADVENGLKEIGREALEVFGGLDARAVNWRPDATQWSVAQCFEHLRTADDLMLNSARQALDGTQPLNMWCRIPFLPRLFGRLLVRSQSPDGTRRFTASLKAQPAMSDLDIDVIRQVAEQHYSAASWVATLDEQEAARTVMTSPFVHVITYSVLDGCRLVVAHDRRHFEQARRITQSPGFPTSQGR